MRNFNPLLLTIALLLVYNCAYCTSFTLLSSVRSFNATNDLPTGTDTIFLAVDSITGKRPALKIKNLIGDSASPIVITNVPGQTMLLDADSFYYALSFDNCHHFILTGDTSLDSCSIKVTGGTGSGVSFGEFCSDFTIRKTEVYDVPGSGIKAKTYAYCGRPDTRFYPNDSIYPDPGGTYIMKNVTIEDNYIHDVEMEGMYIGESFYPIKVETCDTIYSHEIHTLTIKNNLVRKTGWDGIQVGCATDSVSLSYNQVLNYGEAKHAWHMSGFQIGHGTTGKCNNNWIEYGFGHGIVMNGTGDNQVFNNVILQVGKDYSNGQGCALAVPGNSGSATCSDQKDVKALGISIQAPDSIFFSGGKTTGYQIYSNTIVGCKSGGIEYLVDSSITVGSRINNNILSDYHFLHDDEFALGNSSGAIANWCNNFVENNKDSVGFNKPDYNSCSPCSGKTDSADYTLKNGSKAINSGTSFNGIATSDFNDSNRVYLTRIDIGAFEYSGGSFSGTPFPDCPCDHFIPSETSSFDGSSAVAADTICLLPGKRGLLTIDKVEGTSSGDVVIVSHGGVAEFEYNNGILLQLKNSGHVQVLGDEDNLSTHGLNFKKSGSGNVTGIYLANTNSVKVDGVDIKDVNTGIRYRFDKVDTTIAGTRELEVNAISISNVGNALYFGYSSGFSGQEAWELGQVKADKVKVDSADVGLLLYGVNDTDSVLISQSSFSNITQYGIKAEQNSMKMKLVKNSFKDIGYCVLYSKSSYNQPFYFDVQNNLMIRAGKLASSGSDNEIPLFVNFQQKSGSFTSLHNTITDFKGTRGVKTKYSVNVSHEVKNNLLLGSSGSSSFIELNGTVSSTGNYENNKTTADTTGFVDYTNDNLDITYTSVWRNAGDTNATQLSVDYAGNNRSDGLPDIGAYENQSSGKGYEQSNIDNTEVVFPEKELNEPRITVFPNPVQDELTITVDTKEESIVKLFDFSGKELRSMILKKRSAILNLADLSNGIYIVRLVTNSRKSLAKMITKL